MYTQYTRFTVLELWNGGKRQRGRELAGKMYEKESNVDDENETENMKSTEKKKKMEDCK